MLLPDDGSNQSSSESEAAETDYSVVQTLALRWKRLCGAVVITITVVLIAMYVGFLFIAGGKKLLQRELAVLPLLPTYCVPSNPGMEPYTVILELGGVPFQVVLDTGSSNLVVASDHCIACEVSPKYKPAATEGGNFNISYGSGGLWAKLVRDDIKLGTLSVPNTSFGVIYKEFTTMGFNLFPPKGTLCYNTFAGVWGMAYQGQDAGPPGQDGRTNGTTVPLFDELVARGMPNAFAIEACLSYPDFTGACAPNSLPGRKDNATWIPTSICGAKQVGNLFLGGWSTQRLAKDVSWTPAMSRVHYDVQLLNIVVCGRLGCRIIDFPDPINGSSEDACACATPTCDQGTVSYCSFSVLDSGAGRIYMNTAANARALLSTMNSIGMVNFEREEDGSEAFWFNSSAAPGATVDEAASMRLIVPNVDGGSMQIDIETAAIFRATADGLVQFGIIGDLDYLLGAQAAKFPTLLGSTVFMGRTIIFDRSRNVIGFAKNKANMCGHIATVSDIDAFGINSDPTPGDGCLIGTGSGGGCKQ
eukprot:TRINITY_DN29785_c0_g1_i2.p1 TRINITY_DN29785_c0_g1~~TRINITY_DN29785_c0_g1_i2.p1  ORF type:complete len:531 (-),score=61.13 TRINITY_DN29785_c0_g1_i2:240-1832(-)